MARHVWQAGRCVMCGETYVYVPKRPEPCPGLKATELDALREAAEEVWNDIAPDCFASLAPSGKFLRGDVVHLVLDCDRLSEKLRQNGHASLVTRMGYMPMGRVRRLVEAVFPDAWYGQ